MAPLLLWRSMLLQTSLRLCWYLCPDFANEDIWHPILADIEVRCTLAYLLSLHFQPSPAPTCIACVPAVSDDKDVVVSLLLQKSLILQATLRLQAPNPCSSHPCCIVYMHGVPAVAGILTVFSCIHLSHCVFLHSSPGEVSAWTPPGIISPLLLVKECNWWYLSTTDGVLLLLQFLKWKRHRLSGWPWSTAPGDSSWQRVLNDL